MRAQRPPHSEETPSKLPSGQATPGGSNPNCLLDLTQANYAARSRCAGTSVVDWSGCLNGTTSGSAADG